MPCDDDKSFVEAARRLGFITQEQAEVGLKTAAFYESKGSPKTVAEILAGKQFLGKEEVGEVLAQIGRKIRKCATCGHPWYAGPGQPEARCPRCESRLETGAPAAAAARGKPSRAAQAATAFLVVLDDAGQAGRRVSLQGDEATLGRSEDCTAPIPDARVSKQHARVVNKAGRWTIEDLKSRNGTTVNGARTAVHALQGGDLVRLGGVAVLFVDRSGGADLDVAKAAGWLADDASGRKKPVGTRPVVVGTAEDADLRLTATNAAPYHAQLTADTRGVHLACLAAPGSVTVNGLEVMECLLCAGDWVGFAGEVFEFRLQAEAPAKPGLVQDLLGDAPQTVQAPAVSDTPEAIPLSGEEKAGPDDDDSLALLSDEAAPQEASPQPAAEPAAAPVETPAPPAKAPGAPRAAKPVSVAPVAAPPPDKTADQSVFSAMMEEVRRVDDKYGTSGAFKPTGADAARGRPAPMAQPGKVQITCIQGSLNGSSFGLGKQPVLIGRSKLCGIRVSEVSVAEEHAQIYGYGSSAEVEVLNDLGNVWVNGQPVRRGKRLKLGDTLQVGDLLFQVHI